MQSIKFDHDELKVAEQWHDGITSMLYAITSTGSLKRSPFERCRPHVECDACLGCGWTSPTEQCRACHGARMTDEQWLAYLAERLENEASEAAKEARLRVRRAKHARRRDEAQEMAEHAVALDAIAARCREAIVALNGGAS